MWACALSGTVSSTNSSSSSSCMPQYNSQNRCAETGLASAACLAAIELSKFSSKRSGDIVFVEARIADTAPLSCGNSQSNRRCNNVLHARLSAGTHLML